MKNFVQEGAVVTVVAPANVASGAGLIFGQLFGVALRDALSGAEVDMQVRGVVALPKVAGSVAVGVLMYWDNTNKRATTVASGNRPIGFHVGKVANAGAADTPILVLLSQSAIVTPA
jgi:predicted RecA/RadA family phage recombinase